MTKFTLVTTLLLISGCSLLPPKVQEVKIPVIVPCVWFTPVKPNLISDAELVKLDDGNFVTALHLDRLQRRGYEAELEAVLAGCINLPEAAK